jgi:tRNA uridine 5-carbamoylmethylation protein Kti12
MHLIVLFGPPAAGKMTVGLELERLTGLRLFHNHMTIEPVLRYFDFGEPAFNRLVDRFRRGILEEVAASNLPGLIFTYVWALDCAGDKAFVDDVVAMFRERRSRIGFVELAASQEERVRRNASPLRLEHKPSKRDRARAHEALLAADEKWRLNSDGDFFYPSEHLKIDNTALGPEEVARRIVERFELPRIQD